MPTPRIHELPPEPEPDPKARRLARKARRQDNRRHAIRTRVEHHLADPDGFRILYQWAPVLGDPERLLLTEVYPLSAVVNTTLEAKLLRDRKAGLLHPAADPRRLADLAWLTAHGLLSLILGLSPADASSWGPLCDEACATLVRAARA